MIDGRTAMLLARVLTIVELRGGELVLTKLTGRWTAQVVIGSDMIPAADRDVAFGHGTLFEALRHLEDELSHLVEMPPTREQAQARLQLPDQRSLPTAAQQLIQQVTAGAPSTQPFSAAGTP